VLKTDVKIKVTKQISDVLTDMPNIISFARNITSVLSANAVLRQTFVRGTV